MWDDLSPVFASQENCTHVCTGSGTVFTLMGVRHYEFIRSKLRTNTGTPWLWLRPRTWFLQRVRSPEKKEKNRICYPIRWCLFTRITSPSSSPSPSPCWNPRFVVDKIFRIPRESDGHAAFISRRIFFNLLWLSSIPFVGLRDLISSIIWKEDLLKLIDLAVNA
jgi:hypothetical protein